MLGGVAWSSVAAWLLEGLEGLDGLPVPWFPVAWFSGAWSSVGVAWLPAGVAWLLFVVWAWFVVELPVALL